MLNAKWDLDSGRTVEFRIAGNFADMRHPFKDFTRKRNGRVGSRFEASCARCTDAELVYTGEMMLADWQEKPGTGMTVRFWLDDEATHHPFAGSTKRQRTTPGEMFALVLVEINEMQEVEQSQPQRKGRTHSQDAHLMIMNPMFAQHLMETRAEFKNITITPQQGKDYVKAVLGLESLSELDHNPAKYKQFREQIAHPYARWNGAM